MAYTSQDNEAIIQRQKKDIAFLNQRLQAIYNDAAIQKRAWAYGRRGIQEAITMADRLKGWLDPKAKETPQRVAQLRTLSAFLKDCERDLDTALAGLPIAEKPSLE